MPCLLDLDSMASRSRHGSLLCPDPQAQAISASPYQICAHQAFAWWNQQDRSTSQHIINKTQAPDLQRQLHAPPRANNGSWNSHTRCWRFLTPSLDLSHTCRQDGLVVHRSTWPENLVIIRTHMRQHAPPGYLSHHHAPVTPSYAEELLLMSSDVTAPRQHATHALIHVIRHVT